jgi:hypothetical protein
VTEQFKAITGATVISNVIEPLMRWCTWCAAGVHHDCPGCTCPCTTVQIGASVDA